MEHSSFQFIPIHEGLTAHAPIIKPAQKHNTKTVQNQYGRKRAIQGVIAQNHKPCKTIEKVIQKCHRLAQNLFERNNGFPKNVDIFTQMVGS
jgi:hypothetical protein